MPSGVSGYVQRPSENPMKIYEFLTFGVTYSFTFYASHMDRLSHPIRTKFTYGMLLLSCACILLIMKALC